MTSILAIEASTDHCSVAVSDARGNVRELHQVAPRRHNQLLFEMLGELLAGGDLVSQGIDCLAYGCGPGSFTGLRVAASAVQGLAFTSGLPVAPVSTLAALAQAAMHAGYVAEEATVFSVLDARINEAYCGLYDCTGTVPTIQAQPWVSKPAELVIPGKSLLVAVGDGLSLSEQFPASAQQRFTAQYPNAAPRARHLLPLAEQAYQSGNVQSAAQVQPVYVRDEISWKKLSEQGKSS